MNPLKAEILSHIDESINFISSLTNLSEGQWRTEIADGKWTIAEVVGHLTPWDEFLLNKRIYYFFQEAEWPKGPDEHKLNQEAASLSRKRSKEETIEEFCVTRQKLLLAIEDIKDELWDKEIVIGKHKLTIYEYLKGFAEHDEHHFNQVRPLL